MHSEGERLLILACGNPQRRDDGAGAHLAEKLADALRAAGRTVCVHIVHQLLPELALEIAGEGVAAVLFVDTRAVAEGSELSLGVTLEPLHDDSAGPSLTHHLGPQTLLLYARELYHRAPPAWLITIPGVDFSHGDGLSPVVRSLLCQSDAVAAQILSLPAIRPNDAAVHPSSAVGDRG